MKERFEVLDIFRGIFSSMVVFFHMSAFSNTAVLNNNLVYNSDLFVDFFFVLSGFVITYSYQYISEWQQFTRFYKKRFFRLYPLHVIMLFAFVFVEFSKQFLSNYIHVNDINNGNNNLTSFFSSLFLVNSIKLPSVNDVSWNIPSWSISAEMIAYLVFGVVMIAIHKFKLVENRNLVYILILATFLVVFYSLTGSFKLTYSFDYGFLRSVIGFFTGVLCFNTYSASSAKIRPLPRAFFHMAEIVILSLIPVLVWYKDRFTQSEYIYEILFFTSIFVFAFERGFISNFLKRVTLLKNVGAYSYSIYMTHTLFLSLFNIIFIRVLHFPVTAYSYLFLVNYILIFVVSKYTYNHIEMRFAVKNKAPAIEAAQ